MTTTFKIGSNDDLQEILLISVDLVDVNPIWWESEFQRIVSSLLSSLIPHSSAGAGAWTCRALQTAPKMLRDVQRKDSLHGIAPGSFNLPQLYLTTPANFQGPGA